MTEEQFIEITRWQDKTFTKATALSKIHHLSQEIKELLIDIEGDTSAKRLEFADCFLLLFGAANKAGMDYEDICNAIEEKMYINKQIMDSELRQATAAFQQHDACDECGKRTDGLTTCTYSHDGSITKLCPDCMEDSGFCYRCGNFCAGMESFDFSDMPGYCRDCRGEIKSEFDDEEDFPDGSLDY